MILMLIIPEMEKIGISPLVAPYLAQAAGIGAQLGGGVAGYKAAKGGKGIKKRTAYARFLTRHPGWATFGPIPGGFGYTMGRLIGGETWGKKGKVLSPYLKKKKEKK